MSETLEIQYEGDKEKLKDEYALGNYNFVGLTKKHGSPVYAQNDDDHEEGRGKDHKGTRSIIIRDWEKDENWIGTVNTSL